MKFKRRSTNRLAHLCTIAVTIAAGVWAIAAAAENEQLNATRLHARISLKSNSLDLDDRGESSQKSGFVTRFDASDPFQNVLKTNGSSESADYDDAEDTNDEIQPEPSNRTATERVGTQLSSDNGKNRFASEETLLTASSALSGPRRLIGLNNGSSKNTSLTGESAPLLRGSLVQNDAGSSGAPNMNDIVSNIMISMETSTPSPFALNATRGTGERELEMNDSGDNAGGGAGGSDDNNADKPVDFRDANTFDGLVPTTVSPTTASPATIGSTSTDASNESGRQEQQNDNFERWLNRIKQHDRAGATKTMATSGEQQPSKITAIRAAAWPQRVQSGALKGAPVKGRPSVDSDANPANGETSETGQQRRASPARQKKPAGDTTTSGGSLSAVKRTVPTSAGQQTGALGLSVGEQLASLMKAQAGSAAAAAAGKKPFEHPFQQQLRQQQQQLIHGIKYPAAQASTISLSSTGFSGGQTGNTTLSFAQSLPTSLPASLGGSDLTETSQSINATTSSNHASSQRAGNGSLATDGSEASPEQNNVYQSQAEILRQVTSAINFEQQLLSNNNSKRQSNNEFMSASGLMRPQADNADSSLDEEVGLKADGATTTESTPTGVQNSTTVSLSADEIDKSFDLLAEKIKLIAAQRQQQKLQRQPSVESSPNVANNSATQSPTWLRPVANLTGLLSDASTVGKQSDRLQSSALSTGMKLDELRELLASQRDKSTAGNSNSNMASLMGQLLQLSESGTNKPGPKTAMTANSMTDMGSAQTGNETGSSSRNKQMPHEVSNVGWMPIATPEAIAELQKQQQMQRQQLLASQMSPANLVKNKLKKFPPIKITQATDNVGVDPKDFAPNNGDEYFNRQLAAMLAANSDPNGGADLIQQQQKQMLGLPVAIIKDEVIELSPNQIEAAAQAAADQILGPSNDPSNRRPMQQQQQQQQQHHFQQVSVRQQQAQVSPGVRQFNQQHWPQQQQQQQQTYLSQGVPKNEQNSQAFEQQTLQNLHPNNNKMASLLHDSSTSLHDDSIRGHSFNANVDAYQPNQLDSVDQSGQMMRSNQILVGRQPAQTGSFGADPQMQRAQQQQVRQQQQQQQPAARPASSSAQQRPADTAQQHQQQLPQQITDAPARPSSEINQELQPRAQPMLTTTYVSGGGPPLRMREISLPKPFGFRAHHSLSYQPSPAIEAVLAGLHSRPRPLAASIGAPLGLTSGNSGSTGGALRPTSLLTRHMTPLRSTLSNEGQRLLAPFIPHSLGDTIAEHSNMNQYPTHTALGTLPVPLMRTNQFLRTYYSQHPRGPPPQPPPQQPYYHQPYRRNSYRRQAPPPGKHLSSHPRLRLRFVEPETNIEEPTLEQQHLSNEMLVTDVDASNELNELPVTDFNHAITLKSPRFIPPMMQKQQHRQELVTDNAVDELQHLTQLPVGFGDPQARKPLRPRLQRAKPPVVEQYRVDTPALFKNGLYQNCHTPHSTNGHATGPSSQNSTGTEQIRANVLTIPRDTTTTSSSITTTTMPTTTTIATANMSQP